MELEEKKKVIVELEDQMNKAGFVTRIEPIEELEMLRIIVDDLGQNQEGSVLMEMCFLPLKGEGIPDELSIFQIFTTIEKDIPKEKTPKILESLNKINLDCILGNFNIFEDEMQMYHKYVCIARGATMEKMLDTIQPAVNWIVSTIQEAYEELIGVCRE